MKFVFLVMILMLDSCQKIPEKKNVLRINISREPTCFDPRKVFDPSHQMLISAVFEGLFKLEKDLSVVPAQVETWEISEDGLKYTFRLGDHIWSDKSPVRAEDFVETFKDLLRPEFPAPHAHLLYDVLGAEEAKKGNLSIEEVGLKVIDEKTFQLVLKRSNPRFLQILASPYLVPVNRKQDRERPGWDFKSPFICNGNFVVRKWIPQAEVLLKRNRNYVGKFPAKLREIRVSLIANEMSAFHMYGNGYFDMLGAPFSQIPLPYLKDLKEQNSLVVQPVAASLFIGFNTQTFPFHNVHMRRALALAINREEIIQHITLLNEEAAVTPIPSVLKGKKPAYGIKDGNEKAAQKELQLALKEIDANQLKGLTLYFWPMEINYLIAQTLQQQWQQNLGLDVNIEVIEFKHLLTKIRDGSYKMAIFAWAADYGDPISLLHRFRFSQDTMNYSHWEMSSFSALLNTAALQNDMQKRNALLEEAEKVLVKEMPIAPIFHWNFSLLIRPEVKGFAMDPLGHIRFDQLYFEEEKSQ